jgi:hypothetical protein
MLEDLTSCTHLIIVCCHAIWLGGQTCGRDESEWYGRQKSQPLDYFISCLSYQRYKMTSQRAIETFQHGETPTFVEHIEAGLRALSEQPQSLLVFSG